ICSVRNDASRGDAAPGNLRLREWFRARLSAVHPQSGGRRRCKTSGRDRRVAWRERHDQGLRRRRHRRTGDGLGAVCLSPQARRARRGTAVMEMALVGSLLLGLTFGTVEFGYYFYVKNIFQGAAREGCRAGITPTGDNTAVTSSVVTYLYNGGLQSGSLTLDT